MKIARRRRRAPYVPTASFGDIAFLLIIFFMVTSTFMREKHIAANSAQSVDLEKIKPAAVSVVLDQNGVIWLQGEPCPASALEPAVSALISDIQDKTVTVRIDRDQPQKNFGDILMALSGAGADIVLLGQKEKEKR